MGQLFNRSKVSRLEPLISSHVEKFVNQVRFLGPRVDLMEACRALEADIICMGTPPGNSSCKLTINSRVFVRTVNQGNRCLVEREEASHGRKE